MPTHKHNHRSVRFSLLRIGGFAVTLVVASFFVGIQTAKDVEIVDHTAAIEQHVALSLTDVRGDLDANGEATIDDLILLLEKIGGLEQTTKQDIELADSDGDYLLTILDALRLARRLR